MTDPILRWALYIPRPGGDDWILRGIFPSRDDAERWGRKFVPRTVVQFPLRGRPPSRFADQHALERWFKAASNES